MIVAWSHTVASSTLSARMPMKSNFSFHLQQHTAAETHHQAAAAAAAAASVCMSA
jgi:hypothetical protein